MTTTDPSVSPAARDRDHRRTRTRVPVDFGKAPALYDELGKLAVRNRRSLNAEILVRLEDSVRLRRGTTPPPE